MNSYYTSSFSNCNAQVKLTVSEWTGDDGEFITEEEAKKIPIIVEWKNLHTSEEKTYRISVGRMHSPHALNHESNYITVSPNGRYIAIWYTRIYCGDPNDGNLYMMVIDTETQELTEGSCKDFGEFIEKSYSSTSEYSIKNCWVRVLDNGLLHIAIVSKPYENYLMDPKTNKVVLNIEKILMGEQLDYYFSDHLSYHHSIATPETLFLIDEGQSLSDDKYDYVFQYDMDTGLTCFSDFRKQTTRDLAEKYTMFPYDLTKGEVIAKGV